MRRVGECPLDRCSIAPAPAKAFRVDRRQDLILHLHSLGHVFCRGASLSEYRGYGLAHVAHCLARQSPARYLHHARQLPSRAHRADTIALHVAAGEDQQSCGDFNLADAGMGMR
jgi:hypothetical protein